MIPSGASSRSALADEPLNPHTAQSGRPRRRRGGGGGRSGQPSTRGTMQAPHRTQATNRPQAIYDPAPVSFTTLGLEPSLLEGVAVRGWEKTTPIQSAVIPIALAGHDVIG